MYFGSVRFFKNLILLAVVILIALPTCLAVHYYGVSAQLAAQLEGELPPTGEDDPSPATDGEGDAEPIYYQTLYPDFYAPQPYQATERVTGTIYLTFDDGPSATTDRILETLARHDVKATFFVIGKTAEKDGDRLRAIVEQGHTLAMHTYSHSYNAMYQSVESYLDDMYAVFTAIKDATGVTPSLFRFAGGSVNSYNGGIYQELLAEMMRRGFVPFDWNISSEDASGSRKTAQEIENSVITQAARVERGIVLMHDSADKGTTADALENIITRLAGMGFVFDRLGPQTRPVLFGYTE